MNDDTILERRGFLGAAAAAAAFGIAMTEGEAQAQEKRPGGLSTHVLNTYSGEPAEGMQIDFYVAQGETYALNKSIKTNALGRTDGPVMPEVSQPGKFRLVFHVSDYFKQLGVELPDPPFLDRVTLDFAIANPKEHYHVPLLCSPWSYVTYRGS